jgi:hypothetical protein
MTGKIYIIRNIHDPNLLYIGSTFADLNYRFNRHRFQNTTRLHKYISENNDDWDNWNIELYEEFECDNREELHKREGDIIRLFLNENPLGTLNKGIAGRTKKEYIRDNIDKIKDIRKRYYRTNINKFSKIITCECGRNFRQDNIYRHQKSKIHTNYMDCPSGISTTITSACVEGVSDELFLNPEPERL